MKFKSILKILLSVAMFALVLSQVDISKLKQVILSIPPYIAVTVVGVYLAGQFLSVVKWFLIAKSGGIDCDFHTALKAYFIGMFVNCFGLGMVGGDVTRGILLSHGKPYKTPAIASVVADRLHGLSVLALIGCLAALSVGSDQIGPIISALDSIGVPLHFLAWCLIIGIPAAWFIGPALLLKIVPKSVKFRRKVEQLCAVFPKDPGVLLSITAISAVFHLVQISLHWLMAYGMGVIIPLSTLLTVIPIVNILSSLPITWNGLGVREKSYVFFLTPHIISQEQAVALGAIWLIAMTFASGIGGIVSMLSNDLEEVEKTKSEDLENEEALQGDSVSTSVR